jgi:hypothetical protein
MLAPFPEERVDEDRVSRLPLVKTIAGAGLIAFAALQTLWFVRRFGVNCVYWDEWEWVRPLWNQLSATQFWSQQNEHRIPVGALLIVGLYRITGVDTRSAMFASWVCLALITVILMVRLRHARPGASLLALAPIAILVFSLRQYENLLWGFQLTLTLSAFFVVAALALLGRGHLRLAGAIGCAVGASLSFASGLMVWPAGLAQLLALHRADKTMPLRPTILWLAGAAVTAAAYLYGWKRPGYLPRANVLEEPLRFFLYFVGLFGAPLAGDFWPAIGVGFVICVVAGFALTLAWRARASEDAFPLSLLVFTTLNALLLTFGRSGFGLAGVMSSRYVVFTLLGVVATYLLVLRATATRNGVLALGALLSLIAAGTFTSIVEDRNRGRAIFGERRERAEILRTYRTQPDSELLKVHPNPMQVRDSAAELEKRGWNVFRKQ